MGHNYESEMSRLKIRDFMTFELLAFQEENTVKEFAELFYRHQIDGVPIMNHQGDLAGIFTKTHLYRVLNEVFVSGSR